MIDGAFGEGMASKIAGFAATVAGVGVAIAGGMVVVPLLTAGFVALGPPLAVALGFFTSAPALIGLAAAGLLGLTGNLPTLGELIAGVGFGIRNFGLLAELSFLKLGAFVAGFIDNLALIPQNFMTIAKFIGGNFVEIATTALSIVGQAVRDLASSIFSFLSDPMKGFSFDLTKTFAEVDSLKRTMATMPPLAVAAAPDISGRVAEINEQIRKKEEAYAKGRATTPVGPAVNPAVPAAGLPGAITPPGTPAGTAPGALPAGASATAPKLAGAAALGSADAYKTISGAMAAATGSAVGGDEPIQKRSYETNRKALLEHRRSVKLQERMARGIEKIDLQVATV